MADQLALIEIPVEPRLTDRQRFALDAVTRSGADGLHADELGAYLCWRNGKHDPGDRCQWCARNGLEVLRALRDKRLVKYRGRLKIWQANAVPGTADIDARTAREAELHYNEFPPGF